MTQHPPFAKGNKMGLKHGHSPSGSRSATYNSWHTMRKRCNLPTDPGYANYGGRGITCCDRWASFANFLADMGERPSKKYSIERVDNSKGYEPSNCVWATKAQQSQNSRRTRLTWVDVRHIRSTGMTPKEIVAHYDVAIGTAYAVYQGKTWKE